MLSSDRLGSSKTGTVEGGSGDGTEVEVQEEEKSL
jgi:hypothetical protein